MAVGLEEAVQQQHAPICLSHTRQQPLRCHLAHRGRQCLALLLPRRPNTSARLYEHPTDLISTVWEVQQHALC